VNKKDILLAKSASDPLQKVILGFSTKANTSDVAQQLEDDEGDVKFISGPIIYHIMDAFEEWQDASKALIEEEQRESIVYPGKVLFLKDHTFRAKGPAIVGMRVLGGRIHVGQRLMKLDGTPVGQVKSLRTRASEDVKEAMQGDEVAVAVQGPTVGRHIEELDQFYVDVPERHVKRLKKVDLSPVEEEILEEIVSLHRKDNHFWGR
jgi:translation initiation factor 5B